MKARAKDPALRAAAESLEPRRLLAASLSGVQLTPTVEEGQAALLAGSIDGNDAGVRLRIDWGDGTGAQFLDYAAGTTSFSASHSYADDATPLTGADRYVVRYELLNADGSPIPPPATPISGSDGFGYRAYEQEYEPLDLVPGSAGVFPIITGTGVNFFDLNRAIALGDNHFTFYDQVYASTSDKNQLFVNPNGLLVMTPPPPDRTPSGSGSGANTNMVMDPISPSLPEPLAAVAPLWDNWMTDVAADTGVYGRFDNLDADPEAERLIVEWRKVLGEPENGEPASPESVTFQAVLELNTGGRPGDIIFNYADVDSGDNRAGGASATVGIRAAGIQGPVNQDDARPPESFDRLLVSYNKANANVAAGKAIRLSAAGTARVIVRNVAPTINITPAAADEGQALAHTGSFEDPAAEAAWSGTVDYGDDSPPQDLFIDPATRTFALDHVYADSGNYTATIEISDDDGGTVSAAVAVTVANVAPVASLSAPGRASEGSTVVVSVSGVNDPSPADAAAGFEYSFDVGNGYGLFAAANSVTFVPADEQTRVVRARVRDKDGGVTEYAGEVVVTNVAPSIPPIPAASLVEGSTLQAAGSFADPGADNWSATVDYGDGGGAVPLDLAAGKAFTLGHRYADDGTYEVTVVVNDGDGDTGATAFDVTVSNAAPVASIAAPAPDLIVPAGTLVPLAGTFTDEGTADLHSAGWTVDGGVGAVPVAGQVTEPAGTEPGAVNAEYVFAQPGTYRVVLTVSDDDGGSGAAETTVRVLEVNVAPRITALSVQPDAVSEGATVTLAGSYSYAGADLPGVAVTWGDGTSTVAQVDPGAATFTATHTYVDNPAGVSAGTFPVSVALTTAGGTAEATSSVAVANVAPAGAVSVPASVVSGRVGDYLASFTDAGSGDVLSATLEWGDGTPAALTTATGAGTIVATHVYREARAYTLTLTVTDGDGARIVVTRDVCVAAVAPQGDAVYVGGTSGNDVISLAPSAVAGKIDVVLNGVNLGAYAPARFVIFAGAGDDTVHGAGAVTTKVWMYGEAGNDTLNMGNGGGLAFGGPGNDQLNGGGGREIMVGGEGADKIVGNPGDDILITAVTKFDNRFAVASHEEAWNAIAAEWWNTARTFRQRVDNLRNGTGCNASGVLVGRANGDYFLNDSTVDDDTSADVLGTYDQLTGTSGEDWFIYKAGEDKVTNMTNTEACQDLTIY